MTYTLAIIDNDNRFKTQSVCGLMFAMSLFVAACANNKGAMLQNARTLKSIAMFNWGGF